MTLLEKLINESDCPVSFSIEKTCPERPYQPKPGDPWWPKPTKRLEVGSTMPLTFEWIDPDDWLARASERLARLLYKVRIRWPRGWGQWKLLILEAEGEVIRDDETGSEWRVTPGVKTEGHKGTFAEMERLLDD